MENYHNSNYIVLLQKMIAQLQNYGNQHDQAVEEIEVLREEARQMGDQTYNQAVAEIDKLRGEAQLHIDSLQAQMQQLQEHEKEATIRQLQLSETQPERKTELGHDMNRLSAEFLQGPDLAALAETSKAGKRVVTSLGLPSQPYLQKCALPYLFGVLPPNLRKFTEGCEDLWKNILGLFSDVIVMAKEFNDGEEHVINMVKFDIQDHTDNPKTIFPYNPTDTEIPFQVFTWNTGNKKFSVMKPLHSRVPPVYLDEEELVRAIQNHWAVRLPPSSKAKTGFWAPVIEFKLNQRESLVEIISTMDKKMDTALNKAGTLAQSYSFITNHTSHFTQHESRYALFHQDILHKKGNALLQVRPWTMVPDHIDL